MNALYLLFWSQHSPMSIVVSCDSGWNSPHPKVLYIGWNSPYLAPSQSSIYWLATTQPNWLHSNKSHFLSLTCLCCHNVNFYCNHLEKVVTTSNNNNNNNNKFFNSLIFFGFFCPYTANAYCTQLSPTNFSTPSFWHKKKIKIKKRKTPVGS